MKVKIIEEHGYDTALRGMAYSFKDRVLDPESWWKEQRERATKRAPKLAPMGGGHNKFIRQIELWVDIEMCRAMWSEFDTYKVGTVADSESTMHTLSKRAPNQYDFEDGTPEVVIMAFQEVWKYLKENGGDIAVLKQALPEGYLQRRMVTMNYEVLRNIISQRQGHRFKWWDVFIKEIMSQVEHPELLQDLIK
jgi:hypothetical protein